MRKTLLFLVFWVGMLTSSHAEGYNYLTFETTDGAKASVSLSSLSLTISGSTLKAGTQTFTLSNLTKMYFSTTDESTGIATLTADSLKDVIEIYDLQGKKVDKEQLAKGVYIIKTKGETYKIVSK